MTHEQALKTGCHGRSDRAGLWITLLAIVGCSAPPVGVPADEPSKIERAEILIERGDHEEAVAVLSDVLATNDRDPSVWTSRAIAHERLGQLDKAEDDYGVALRHDPGHVRALNNRASLRARDGRLEDAIADLSAVLAVAPDDLLARQNRALAYFDTGRFDDALADLDAADRLSPNNPVHAFRRGRIAQADHDAAAALQWYDRSLAWSDENTEPVDLAMAHAERGRALRTLGRVDDAIAAFEAAAELDASFGADRSVIALRREQLAADALKRAGHDVVWADDGLAVTMESRSQLILLLPVENGAAVLTGDQLQAIRAIPNLPVVLVDLTADTAVLENPNAITDERLEPTAFRLRVKP